MQWKDEIFDAFQDLGGAARYSDLYEYISRTTSRGLTKHWKATVRRTIEDHSSDSANFRAADLFEHLDWGFWGLRGRKIDEGLLEQRRHQEPKEVVDKVFVNEHWREWPSKQSSTDGEPEFHIFSRGPRPVAPFSHAVEADGWVILTGQMPTDPDAPDAPLPEGIVAQTERVMANLALILRELGLDLSHIVQCRCYLTEFGRDYAAFNDSYKAHFAEGRLPARTTVGVTALAVGALVEIDCIARRPLAQA